MKSFGGDLQAEAPDLEQALTDARLPACAIYARHHGQGHVLINSAC